MAVVHIHIGSRVSCRLHIRASYAIPKDYWIQQVPLRRIGRFSDAIWNSNCVLFQINQQRYSGCEENCHVRGPSFSSLC
jgi:hypothetical protein